jgi:hypothetical protein
MLLIFGLRTKVEVLGIVSMACPGCGRDSNGQLVREHTRFSLFFIPLIPIRTRYAVYCLDPFCGGRTTVSAEKAHRLLATGVRAPH